jgi:outer membrane protein TolC
MAEVRRQNNMLNQGDYLKALADRESSLTARNQARRNLSLKNAQLRSLLGLSGLPELEAVNFEYYEKNAEQLAQIPDAEIDRVYLELWKIAESRNPSFTKSGMSRESAEQNLTLAKRDFLPTVSASFSTGLNYSPLNGLEPTSGRISLSGSIPLDVWVTANSVAKKKNSLEQAGLDYRSAESTLALDLQSAILDLVAQAGMVSSSRRALVYTEEHFKYIMELYRLSQNSVSELADASAQYITSRNQLINAQYSFLQAISRLRSLGAFDNDEDLMRILFGRTGEA